MYTISIILSIVSIILSIFSLIVFYRINIYISSFEEDYDDIVLRLDNQDKDLKNAIREDYLEKEYDENNNLIKTTIKKPRIKTNK